MIIHGNHNEYDYLYIYEDRPKIIKYLQNIYKNKTSKDLIFCKKDDKDLSKFVVSKKERTKNPYLYKIEQFDFISIKDFIEEEERLKKEEEEEEERLRKEEEERLKKEEETEKKINLKKEIRKYMGIEEAKRNNKKEEENKIHKKGEVQYQIKEDKKEEIKENNNIEVIKEDKIEIIKEDIAPPPTAKEEKLNNKKDNDSNNIGYNCSECGSLIKILLIKENKIEFECKDNNHNKILNIKEYIEKMQKYNNTKFNEICDKHNKLYYYYCFNCKYHLCLECLKSKKHKLHNKEI